MKRILLAFASSALLYLPAQAENVPVVVELFTSQGCSSCPPADDMMQILVGRDDVIPLSLHVDYWDYIGWKDEFAVPGNAKRQRSYAARAGRRSVYTPEMIVNGVSDIIGAKPMKLAMAIEKHKSEKRRVSLAAARKGGVVEISAKALDGGLGRMDVVLLRYQPTRVASITRGENAGRTIEYMNVTQDWQVLRQWDGREALEFSVEVPGDMPAVVLIQSENLGPIRAATEVAR